MFPKHISLLKCKLRKKLYQAGVLQVKIVSDARLLQACVHVFLTGTRKA